MACQPLGGASPLDGRRSIYKHVCMSTKTIAVNTEVYERLAAAKREGESFSKVIDRLLTQAAGAHTGKDILGHVARFPALPEEDAEVFMQVIAESRAQERWHAHDLR